MLVSYPSLWVNRQREIVKEKGEKQMLRIWKKVNSETFQKTDEGYCLIEISLPLVYAPTGTVGVVTPPRDGTAAFKAVAKTPFAVIVAILAWISACVTPGAGMTENKQEMMISASEKM